MSDNLLNLIGNTPIVEIRTLNTNDKVRLFAKLESFNPGGSVKDRIAKHMIEGAEETGELTKDKIVLEPTSGNTGIGLALTCAVKGYRLKIVMPETMSLERRWILQAMGAEIMLTDGTKGMPGTIEAAIGLATDSRYFMPNQFENRDNPLTHYVGTSKEILSQVGEFDVFVAGIGTGGTLMGVGKRLRENNNQTKIVGVEPYPEHRIQGLRNLSEGYLPPIFDSAILDEKVNVSDEEAFDTAKDLARYEGLLVGISSGAAMAEALKQAKRLKQGKIVVMLPDGGDRYLSTELFRCPYFRKCPRESDEF